VADRDRDQAGRARNARPRDALGRPLARTADGEPVLPDDAEFTQDRALVMAQRLLDEGRPFHAHEVLEAAWKNAEPGERDLWQGLTQLAVGLTHALRGNATGAVVLLRRGRDRLGGYPDPGPHGVDVGGLIRAATALTDRIEAGGLASIDPADLRLVLARDVTRPIYPGEVPRTPLD
jgi:uncharacterized protein